MFLAIQAPQYIEIWGHSSFVAYAAMPNKSIRLFTYTQFHILYLRVEKKTKRQNIKVGGRSFRPGYTAIPNKPIHLFIYAQFYILNLSESKKEKKRKYRGLGSFFLSWLHCYAPRYL